MKSEEVFRDAQNKDDVKDAALADVSELLRTLRNAGYILYILYVYRYTYSSDHSFTGTTLTLLDNGTNSMLIPSNTILP